MRYPSNYSIQKTSSRLELVADLDSASRSERPTPSLRHPIQAAVTHLRGCYSQSVRVGASSRFRKLFRHLKAVGQRVALLSGLLVSGAQASDEKVARWGKIVKREAQFIYGLSAPTPMFLAQIQQESSGRDTVVSGDGGMGLAQFTGGTIDFAGKLFPDLGAPAPLNVSWAIPAMIRYDGWLRDRVKGDTLCDQWAAALKSYNAGLGYVKRAQGVSLQSGVWFGATEWIPSGQSAKNFEYSRMYPRWILLQRQTAFSAWGTMICQGVQ